MKTSEVAELPLSKIFSYEDNRELNTDYVKTLIARGDVASFPPIWVIEEEDGRFGCVDGQHRVEAARTLKAKAVKAILVEYDNDEELIAHRFELNVSHGLLPTKQQRKDHARWLAETYPEMSLREIGRRTGLDDHTAKRAIKGETAEGSGGAEASSVTKFCRAMRKFHDEESAFLSSKNSERSIAKRRKLIIEECRKQPELVPVMESLAKVMMDAAREARTSLKSVKA
jgi:ParB-like chromosome segregation protein Spo0J